MSPRRIGPNGSPICQLQYTATAAVRPDFIQQKTTFVKELTRILKLK